MSRKRLVTLIPGDSIGPEVVRAARRVVEATAAPVAWQKCEVGAEVFRRGVPSGVPAETIESIRQTRVVLKGPLETPVGLGGKSANGTLRAASWRAVSGGARPADRTLFKTQGG